MVVSLHPNEVNFFAARSGVFFTKEVQFGKPVYLFFFFKSISIFVKITGAWTQFKRASPCRNTSEQITFSSLSSTVEFALISSNVARFIWSSMKSNY